MSINEAGYQAGFLKDAHEQAYNSQYFAISHAVIQVFAISADNRLKVADRLNALQDMLKSSDTVLVLLACF